MVYGFLGKARGQVMPGLRLLFVGESWLGSCARSLKEALTRQPGISLDEVNEDLIVPRPQTRWLRAVHRLLLPAYVEELSRQILRRVSALRPDVVMTYKGSLIGETLVRRLRSEGCALVNVYPDLSPHAHGAAHRQAIGAYDLVISTKPFHPELWRSVYGYENRCVFVPQGYDPALHLIGVPPGKAHFDVVLVATWRAEYGALMRAVARSLAGKGVSFGIGGNGWLNHRSDFPPDWQFAGALQGRSYVEWLRQGRICISPVTREVVIDGARQPGDEDTTRTYELAAAHCFFIHRRTDYARRIYDEVSEVPMYETAGELAEKIMYFLQHEDERSAMAAAAHCRAVPAYSLDRRADAVVTAMRDYLSDRRAS